jgi:hypothetical protein
MPTLQPTLKYLVVGLLMVVLSCSTTSAVTPEELVELAKSGLGDEVLLALIDTTGMPVVIDAPAAVRLRKGGVSNRVIAAAVRAGAVDRAGGVDARAMGASESMAPLASPADQPPTVGVMGAATPVPQVIEREVYYIPWVVPVSVGGARHRPTEAPAPYLAGNHEFGRFINDGSRDRSRDR